MSNSRQDFLHKLSYKLVCKSQAVIVEGLNVKGMVQNHNLAKAISDVGWGMFTNFLDYKLEKKGGKLVEIDRWFPSSKLCSNCFYQMKEMPLDGNAAINIRAEGIRVLQAEGMPSARFAISRLCGKRGGKTKDGTKVLSAALAVEYRSSNYSVSLLGVVH